MDVDKPKVLYMMGTGRSGSTILGLALGNCAHMLCAGELHLWLGKQGCSPLPGAERQRFWSAVREEVDLAPDFPTRQARNLEKTTAIFDARTWVPARRLRNRYRRATEDVFHAIARQSGATHIIDTSHFPRRARQLQELDRIELHLLFVVRDPQSVISSYSRDDVDFPRFNPVTTAAYMWLTYLLSLVVFIRQPRERRLLVRYEAFMADPEGVLRQILDQVGSDAETPDLGALRTGVAFQGNRLLRSDVVALKAQPERPQRGPGISALVDLPWRTVFSRLRPATQVRGRG